MQNLHVFASAVRYKHPSSLFAQQQQKQSWIAALGGQALIACISNQISRPTHPVPASATPLE
jgi:hypothetical protein